MPNAEGRAATRQPRKSTSAAAPAPAAETARSERHVRSPLERAQAVFDKAKASHDKVSMKLVDARAEVTKLEDEQKELKVTLDWAASHPLLVAERKKVAEAAGETPAAPAEPAAPVVSIDSAAVPGFADGSEIVSTVPDGEGEEDGASDDGAEGEMPSFDFDNPPPIPTTATPAAGSPFDQSGPQTVHV